MIPRPLLACCIAETLGTSMLVFFGCGSVHVAVLMGELTGLWQVGIVWGISIMLAIYVFGPISGAHITPASTLGLSSWGLFPTARVVPYIVAQVIGAFLAAAILFAMFQNYLVHKEQVKQVVRGQPGSEITAMCYGEYFPNPGSLAVGDTPYDPSEHERMKTLVSPAVACLAEMLGTAILALVVVAVTAPENVNGPRNLAPVFIGLTVTALICIIAPLTQGCFNPARDFGPRLFAWFAGWGSIAFPSPHGLGLVTVYIVSPIVGAIGGIGLYQLVLKKHVINENIGTATDA